MINSQHHDPHHMSTSRKNFKCVVVGDGAVGKSSLIYMFTYNSFPTDYVPTVFDNCNASVEIDNVTYDLGIWDTAGQEEYDNIRPVSYHNTDVVLLCYDVSHPDSLKNIKERWIKEIHKHVGPNANIILVGTKEDLRNDENNRNMIAQQNLQPISKQQAEQVANEIKAKAHLTCSAKLNQNVSAVFETAVKIAKLPQKKKLCG